MKILGFNFFKKRASQVKGSNGSFLISSNNAATGRFIDSDEALKVSAVWACVRILSETIGSLPLHVYKKLPGGGKEKAPDHYLYAILHDSPNPYQDSMQFFELAMGHLALRGNFYAKKIRSGRNTINELWPLNPDSMRITVGDNGLPVYEYNSKTGVERYKQDEIFHVRGFSRDGLKGLSPIDYAMESIGLALAAEEHGARFFSNGINPSGILQHPQKLSKDAQDRLRDQWKKNFGGLENSHGLIVAEEGMKWQQLSLTNEQSQFIESRKFQTTDIARWFRMPPHMIGDLDKASFSNIEQQSLEFVTYTMRPWLVRFERAIKAQLIPENEKQNYFAEFLVDALLRGDGLTRAQKLQIERMNGVINADEWRELENRNPLPDGQGQKFITPMNMKSNDGTDSGPQQQPAKDGEKEEDPPKTKEEKSRWPQFLDPVFKSQLKRSITRQKKAREASNFDEKKQMDMVLQDMSPCFQALALTLNKRGSEIVYAVEFSDLWFKDVGVEVLNRDDADDHVLNLFKERVSL